MSARANPAVVGGFVVGALVLLVAAVLLFGSGAVLRERVPVVAFFSGNVRGLQEGSPVEFRGVRVGTVTELRLTLDVDSMDVLIPVYMELDPRSLTLAGVGVQGGKSTSARMSMSNGVLSIQAPRANLQLPIMTVHCRVPVCRVPVCRVPI